MEAVLFVSDIVGIHIISGCVFILITSFACKLKVDRIAIHNLKEGILLVLMIFAGGWKVIRVNERPT